MNDGLLLVDKPEGITSFDVIRRLKKATKPHTPALGHAGTLDPFATGLLTVLVGRGTKLSPYLLHANKTYSGLIRFGKSTDSGDPTGEIVSVSEVLPQSLQQIREIAEAMTREKYMQIPPMHSAIKVDGRPLYEWQRKGIEQERKPRAVRLNSFEIHEYSQGKATFRLNCTAGTYVRVVAQDLAVKLGTVGLLQTLRREDAGGFSLTQATSLENAEKCLSQGIPWSECPGWVGFDSALPEYPRIELTEQESYWVSTGQKKVLPLLLSKSGVYSDQQNLYRLVFNERLYAVAKRTAVDQIVLERVFISSSASD